MPPKPLPVDVIVKNIEEGRVFLEALKKKMGYKKDSKPLKK